MLPQHFGSIFRFLLVIGVTSASQVNNGTYLYRRRHNFPLGGNVNKLNKGSIRRKRSLQHEEEKCPKMSSHDEFLVIGHAGGDPIRHCENTLEATWSALARGANAIEIDVAMSKDLVPFLWHDPCPLSPLALLRRFGLTLSGKCRPRTESNMPASTLSWNKIRRKWRHEFDVANSSNIGSREIASLEQWLSAFANDSRLKLIWLDVKVDERISELVKVLANLIHRYNVAHEKIQFSTQYEAVGRTIRNELWKIGLFRLANNVVSDTVSFYPYVDNAERYNAITKVVARPSNAGKICGCCANIGKPIFAVNQWSGMKNIVNFNVEKRDRWEKITGSHVKIYVWTINDPARMSWLIKSGVDGIITNKPDVLKSVVNFATSSNN